MLLLVPIDRVKKIKIHVHVGDLKPLELLFFKYMLLLPLIFSAEVLMRSAFWCMRIC